MTSTAYGEYQIQEVVYKSSFWVRKQRSITPKIKVQIESFLCILILAAYVFCLAILFRLVRSSQTSQELIYALELLFEVLFIYLH